MARNRALDRRTQDLLLYPLAAWGIALVGLFLAERSALSLALCFALALWNSAVALAWAIRTERRLGRGEVEREEVRRGVVALAQVLAVASVTPAIVFLATDPFAAQAWGTVAGVVAVGAAVYFGASLLERWPNRYVHAVVLTLAWLALPINATGSVSVATWLGWFDALR